MNSKYNVTLSDYVRFAKTCVKTKNEGVLPTTVKVLLMTDDKDIVDDMPTAASEVGGVEVTSIPTCACCTRMYTPSWMRVCVCVCARSSSAPMIGASVAHTNSRTHACTQLFTVPTGRPLVSSSAVRNSSIGLLNHEKKCEVEP